MKRLLTLPCARSSDGLTLIELMVAVAIVGVIAAVSIPRYAVIQARSRQNEAKVNLTAAYTALLNFEAEKDSFSFCLREVGVEPLGGLFYYSAGFYPDNISDVGLFYDFEPHAVTGVPTGIAGRQCVFAAAPSSNMPFAANVYQGPNRLAHSNTLNEIEGGATPTMVSRTQFRLGAQGDIIDFGSRTVPDAWTMDHNKILVNVSDGLVRN